MKPLLIALVIFIFFFSYCMKEYSQEGIGFDVLPPPIEKKYIYRYDIDVKNNWELSYVMAIGNGVLLDAFTSQDSSHRYKDSIDLRVNSNLNLDLLKPGDTILLHCELVWLSGNSTYLNYDTLIK